MKKLPEKTPDLLKIATPRRISSWLVDPELQKKAFEFNQKYYYWSELKYRIKDEYERKQVWAVMKTFRMLRYELILFQNFLLQYTTLPQITRSLHTFDRYLSGTIRIRNKAIQLDKSYIINSLMDEAIASSILEGAVTTQKVAKEMLRKHKKPRTPGEQMVLNNYETMQFIAKNTDRPLTPELICEIHQHVTKETLEPELVGQFRTSDDIVVADPVHGEIYHTPPKAAEVPGMIASLCEFANHFNEPDPLHSVTDEEETGYIHPIIRGIILHFLIGYIHPFEDGNGRTARSIFYWYMLSQGYWLFEYMAISKMILRSKKNYALAYLYTEYDDMDLTYFILYNITCLNEALQDLFTYLEEKQTEQLNTTLLIKTIKEISPRQAKVLSYLTEHSDEYFTIREIKETFDVVYQTARTDLLHLTDLGYLNKEKRGNTFMFIVNEKSP